MISDFLLATDGQVDSMTLERAIFKKKVGVWRESVRTFLARCRWDTEGRIRALEESNDVYLYAYDSHGMMSASYVMDTAGKIKIREFFERDHNLRLQCKTVKNTDSMEEKVFDFEYDATGRLRAERCGKNVRVEKFDAEGRILTEYTYDGERPDLVKENHFDTKGLLLSTVIRDPDGALHRRTLYTWDAHRLVAEITQDGDDRILTDKTYVYGATHGENWLERVTWVSDGSRKAKRQPLEAIYRSLSYREVACPIDSTEITTLAFSNGVYHGPVLDNKPEGIGVFHYNDESRYEGAFHHGVMEGSGTLLWPDGRIMEGIFCDGILEGRGRCTWADGSCYEGFFRHGRMDGSGIFTWADGTRFDGMFENGRRTDNGSWERMEKK